MSYQFRPGKIVFLSVNFQVFHNLRRQRNCHGLRRAHIFKVINEYDLILLVVTGIVKHKDALSLSPLGRGV